VPAVAGGVAWHYKYPKVASALFGIAVGGAVSTAEYMAYAKEAQTPVTTPKGTYYWVLVHKDASLDKVEEGVYTLAEISAKDALVVKRYEADPDIIQISRKNPDGSTATLATKGMQAGGAVRLSQSGAAFRLPQAQRTQTGSAVRIYR
jgi:hypothetical protein